MPVMAVRGIGIERDVGQHADLRRGVLGRPDRAADQIVGVERLARVVAAQLGRRVGEQGDAGNAEVARFPRPLADPVDRPARDAGQGRDRLLDPLPFGDEQRPDQVRRGQHRLGDQRAAPGGGAGAAQAKGGKGGGGHLEPGLARPIPPAKRRTAGRDRIRYCAARIAVPSFLASRSDQWHPRADSLLRGTPEFRAITPRRREKQMTPARTIAMLSLTPDAGRPRRDRPSRRARRRRFPIRSSI